MYDLCQVAKTQMASNRSQSMVDALKTVWSRGGVLGLVGVRTNSDVTQGDSI